MSDMKSVISNRKFYKYTELFEQHQKDGDFKVIEGAVYVGKEPNKFNEEKSDYIFEKDNVEHVLNTCGHLTWQMNKLEQGDLVTAIYKGKQELTQGKFAGKSAHQWDIQFKRPEDKPKLVMKALDKDETADVPF